MNTLETDSSVDELLGKTVGTWTLSKKYAKLKLDVTGHKVYDIIIIITSTDGLGRIWDFTLEV